jgi:uncharacterized membrane protein (UPF0182 family)
LVVAIGLVWPSVAGYYTDWLWFGETGYRQIFLTSLLTRLGLGAAVALAAFLILFGNLRLALRRFDEPYIVLGLSPADGTPFVLQRRGVSHLVSVASALAAAAAGVLGSSRLMDWLQFRHAASFGDRDPIFGQDVSFYVFQLPWYGFVRDVLLGICCSLAGSTLVYLLPGQAAGAGATGLCGAACLGTASLLARRSPAAGCRDLARGSASAVSPASSRATAGVTARCRRSGCLASPRRSAP